VAGAEMASVESPSTSRLKDSESSASSTACDQSPGGASLLMVQNTSGETVNGDTGYEIEVKLEPEGDGLAVKKPRLDVASSHSNIEDETRTMKEPKLEPETGSGSEDVTESVRNKRPWSGVDEESGGAAKKPRLDTESVSGDEGSKEPGDRRRGKSTSASVLLGLVKSRVRKLAAKRSDRKAVCPDTVVSSTSQTSTASSTTSSPRISTPPGECFTVYPALLTVG